MGSRAMLLLRGLVPISSATHPLHHFSSPRFSEALGQKEKRLRNYTVKSNLEPPNLLRLAKTARISLSPQEAEEFAPKIQQMVDWFGQLQAVDLQSIEPAIRADSKVGNFRDDLPETFGNREAMIAAVPSYEEPYIKVPKVLNKE